MKANQSSASKKNKKGKSEKNVFNLNEVVIFVGTDKIVIAKIKSSGEFENHKIQTLPN